ncbi:hypothetical protein [Autumnicola musiva]|uniref:ApeA N-terminal domain-containing protein n=1 Tax=Autumnicola musiva TaxID=3075589 RepID=A0ABU3D4Z2_9FLAO|nr:hypothetical protein [Zunongwangia sp. F117]MDT0676476.1 hypothetical protein [Zunongwangia sp. F117]
MMNERTIFNLKIDIKDLNISSENTEKIFKTELLVDEAKNNEISLKIFYDDELGRQIMSWTQFHSDNILKRFHFVDVQEPENLKRIEFLDYRVKGMHTSTDFHESGKQFIILKLTGVKKIFYNTYKDSSIIYLNREAFKLIELNYIYTHSLFWDKEYKWKPVNNIQNNIEFNKISFVPKHKFTHENNSSQKVVIKKDPIFHIEYSELKVNDINDHVKLLCKLYSFIIHENIDYSISRIFTENELHVEIKDVTNNEVNSHGLFWFDFGQNPLNFILNVDSPHLLKNLNFLSKIIDRFNYALRTSDESKFMILYNILEQIRNEYILSGKIDTNLAGEKPNLKKVVEEYNFNISKRKTDKFISQSLETIADIISEEDKELFIKEIKFKLTPIKVKSMSNQFKSLFEHLNIKPEEFEIDFKELKSLRDAIFHGRPINENLNALREINRYDKLPKFVGRIILKYCGIEDLKNIERIPL